jgi:large subunit ribosomal protein L22
MCLCNTAGMVTTKNRKQGSSAEAYAIGRHIHMSANKVRRVIDQIRGRSYEESLMILELMPYRACDPILKLVYSAAANASNNLGLDQASLIVSKAYVNEGVTRKKPRPQARGRAYAVRRRTCHITVAMKDSSV